ncbi:hypothetical protein BC938DRAFT_482817 [Jimgerdemannia flammicorona]|uniref:Uncharacterized protein n=1 Tax=Jimgerdemannia flammicorona TaxID=994334 RepID=A0A433QDB0_9FUNG|nr:hypothetical protein BC938DRAFT_482817 [Jimgerdemannia flammicorona]
MNCKKVHFGNDVEFIPTFADDEYDRTCQEVAKMTYSDMVELLQVKAEYRRQMEKIAYANPARRRPLPRRLLLHPLSTSRSACKSADPHVGDLTPSQLKPFTDVRAYERLDKGEKPSRG